MQKHLGKWQETVIKLGKHNIEGITMIMEIEISERKWQNVSRQNGKHQLTILPKCQSAVTVYGNNLPTEVAKKVIACYLAEISQLMHLMISPKLHMLMATCKMQWVPVINKTLSYLSIFLKQKA